MQRSADIAKVLGVDHLRAVLAKVETAMRGRTAGLKDYGVQVEKGASQTDIFNAFMAATPRTTAGRSDTTMGTFHATMGNLTETNSGKPSCRPSWPSCPSFKGSADWAKNNHTAFVAIVLVVTGLALAFSDRRDRGGDIRDGESRGARGRSWPWSPAWPR